MRPGPESAPARLDRISTHWSRLNDPAHFALRYAPAVRSYLRAILRRAEDVDEVTHDFLLRVVQRGFRHADPDRGRFRDYLKTCLRHAALNHLRRAPRGGHHMEALAAVLAGPDTLRQADELWLAEWRTCLLDRAWHALDCHERRTRDNYDHTALRLAADYPDDDSTMLATRAAARLGRPLRADAFRKQVSRARRRFAELLVREIAKTLRDATPEQIEEELADLGLMDHVRPFLPPDWRTCGRLVDPNDEE
jgi:RNA polymerase sigma-70 factor (ECF subfamily)